MVLCREPGDQSARQHGPASDRRAEPSLPGQHLDGRECGRGAEAAVLTAYPDDRHHAEKTAEHDGDDREAVATRPPRRRQHLLRPADDPVLAGGRRWWRRRRRQRYRVWQLLPQVLVQIEAGDAGDAAGGVRDRLPVGRDDSAGQRQVRTAKGTLAREPGGPRLRG